MGILKKIIENNLAAKSTGKKMKEVMAFLKIVLYNYMKIKFE